MAEITHVTTHLSDALDRLIERYREKPNFTAFMSIYPEKLQELEDAVIAFVNAKWLDDAVGEQLDKLGLIVGCLRRGYDDDLYRILIKVQILINSSEGQAPDLINIFKDLTQGTLVRYINEGHASASLMSNGTNPFSDNDLFYELMERVAAGGVRLNTLGLYADVPFGFDPATGVLAGFGTGKFPTMLKKSGGMSLMSLPASGLSGKLSGEYAVEAHTVVGNCVVEADATAIFPIGSSLDFAGEYSILVLGHLQLADISALDRITLGSDDAILTIL
jgi:hypothetical protein